MSVNSCPCPCFMHARHALTAIWHTSSLQRRICSTAKQLPELMQAETAVGTIEVAHLDAADLDAASVILIRSFATSPDSVSVSLRDVG